MNAHRSCRDRSAWLRGASALFVLLTASWAQAQPPQPLVSCVFPAGGQRGKTVEAVVTGANLQGASAVRVSGAGVTGKVVQGDKPDNTKVALTIAPDAEPGVRDIRVATPGGASNRYRFIVGALPEVNEVEPNTEPAQAQRLDTLPVVVNGQLAEPDRDHYRFKLKAGETLVCSFLGRLLLPYIPDAVPGWIDGCLTLRDAAGAEVAWVDDTSLRPDPVLVYKAPKDGEYVLEVRDILYRGRNTFLYRLTLGTLPHLAYLFPMGAQRNTETEVELHGLNLPAASLKVSTKAIAGRVRLVGPPGCDGLPFAVGDDPETRETEPNDALAQANVVTVPCTINGRIQRGGDSDYFRFAAKAGQTLVIDVEARRLGSPLDGFLYLYNASGGELGRSDDNVDLDPSQALLTHHADPRLVYTFPAAGDYVIRLHHVQKDGGEDFTYRLSIAPPRPDFALLVSPDNPRLTKGDTAALTARVVRKDGFGGEIVVSPRNLPPGVTASETVIPAGQELARLTVTAGPAAPAGLVALSFAGKAMINNAPVERPVEGFEEITQAFSLHHNVPTREVVLAVLEPSGLTLSTNVPLDKVLEAAAGKEIAVVVKAVRHGGAKGPVNVSLDAPPPGITLKTSPTVIPPDKNEAAVTLVVAKEAPVGLRQNVILTGTLANGKESYTRLAPAVAVKAVAPAK
jgi:Bacterial pre-peptidase C-terminal domain